MLIYLDSYSVVICCELLCGYILNGAVVKLRAICGYMLIGTVVMLRVVVLWLYLDSCCMIKWRANTDVEIY